MMLVDANILLYAEDKTCLLNAKAASWLDEQLSGSTPLCLCWPVINAFLRISTNSRVYERPLLINEAVAKVQSWFNQPCLRLIGPTDNHWEIMQLLLIAGQAAANLVPDAHLAALAIEHGCVLYSTDADFSRFPKLKWINPLK
jgi:hypothetical protein